MAYDGSKGTFWLGVCNGATQEPTSSFDLESFWRGEIDDVVAGTFYDFLPKEVRDSLARYALFCFEEERAMYRKAMLQALDKKKAQREAMEVAPAAPSAEVSVSVCVAPDAKAPEAKTDGPSERKGGKSQLLSKKRATRTRKSRR